MGMQRCQAVFPPYRLQQSQMLATALDQAAEQMMFEMIELCAVPVC